MEERIAQEMTWHGLPILEPTLKNASCIGGERISPMREKLRGVPTMARLPTRSHEAMSSRAHERSERRMPSAPPMS